MSVYWGWGSLVKALCLPAAVWLLAGCSSTSEPPPEVKKPEEPEVVVAEPAPTCSREPAPADRERAVVVARPYDDGFAKVGRYEVLRLSADGKLSRTGETFRMRPSFGGRIVFTPDGEVGYVRQEDGTIGVFRIGADGVEVLSEGYAPPFYVSRIAMGPKGRRLLALSSEWQENGGGIYVLEIDCDGHLSKPGLLAGAKLPRALALLPGPRLMVAARSMDAAADGHDVHFLSVDAPLRPSSPVRRLTGADAFGDDRNVVSDLTLTPDRRYALLSDTSLEVGDRVVVGRLHHEAPRGLSPVQTLRYRDPNDVIVSPFNNAALVLGVQANRITVLGYHPGSSQPFEERGRLAASTAVQLPTNGVMIERGPLEGRVLISENTALRQAQFHPDGRVTEAGVLDFGQRGSAVVSTIGVQP